MEEKLSTETARNVIKYPSRFFVVIDMKKRESEIKHY